MWFVLIWSGSGIIATVLFWYHVSAKGITIKDGVPAFVIGFTMGLIAVAVAALYFTMVFVCRWPVWKAPFWNKVVK